MARLPERPTIPSRFTVIPVKAGEFRFHSFSASLSISSKSANLLARLLPLLDGTRRVSDLLRELRSFGEDQVLAMLEQLQAVGVIEDDTTTAVSNLSQAEKDRYQEQVTFFSHFTASTIGGDAPPWPDIPHSGLAYQEKLKQARVAVFGLGRLGSQLVRLLALAGVGCIIAVDEGLVTEAEANSDAWFSVADIDRTRCAALHDLVTVTSSGTEFVAIPRSAYSCAEMTSILAKSDFAVLSNDHFNPTQYEALNQACLQTNIAWTSCRFFGFEFNIGPTVIPYRTPCYRCFDLRQKGNLTDYEEYLLLEGFLRTHPLHSGLPMVTPGISLVALEVIKALTHFMEPATYAHLYSLNLLTLESKRHPILKVPRCLDCGRSSQSRPTIQAWQLIPEKS